MKQPGTWSPPILSRTALDILQPGVHNGQMPTEEHHAKTIACVPCAIITVSDTRTFATDKSGSLIRERLEAAGHQVIHYEILPDQPEQVRDQILSLCDQATCRAVFITGGTGLSTRDTTYEAVVSLLEKRLDGFGELFRMLSYEDIGAAAMLSRAVAGVRDATLVFSMPGSPAAVRLALDKLILPELGHLAWLVSQA